MKPFGIITSDKDRQDHFPGADSMYADWAEASIAELTQDKKDKLQQILDSQENHIQADVVEPKMVDQVSEDNWEVIWQQIPEDLRRSIERGIQSLRSNKEKSGDLVLGRWAKKHTGGWEQTVGEPTFEEKYSFVVNKHRDKEIPNASNIVLVLRVSSVDNDIVDLEPELLEVPSTNSPKMMVMPGMIFHKILTAQEFLQYLTEHRSDLSIGDELSVN